MSHKLIEIPPSEWTKLRNLYVEHKNVAMGYNLIQFFIDWAEQNMNLNFKLYSLDGIWKEDGTFVAIVDHFKHVYCNTLSDNFDRLVAALNCIDINENYEIYGFSERIKPAILEYYNKNGAGNTEFNPIGAYWHYISKEQALKYSTDPPAGITLARLKVEHADYVNSLWPYRQPGSFQLVEHLIRYKDSVGAFDNAGNLVAWCLISPLGELGLLQVVDTHKRQGLGSLLVRYLSKLIAAKDMEVMAAVVFKNQPSLAMFKNLGFEIIDNNYWAMIRTKEN